MTDQNPIRVLVVDDHTVVRRGLSAFMDAFDDLELVGEAASGEEALRLCIELKPDVVLMDLVMPGMDGVTATSAIRKHCPDTQVIALTSFGELERIKAAAEAGAIGYLLKDVSAEQLATAIRDAVAGLYRLAPQAAKVLIEATIEQAHLGNDLTKREREVLGLMVKGLKNTEIAEHLVISNSTVKFHISSIMYKLGVDNRTEAVAIGLKYHLIT